VPVLNDVSNRRASCTGCAPNVLRSVIITVRQPLGDPDFAARSRWPRSPSVYRYLTQGKGDPAALLAPKGVWGMPPEMVGPPAMLRCRGQPGEGKKDGKARVRAEKRLQTKVATRNIRLIAIRRCC
jgi:hypothetical protein